MGSVLALGLALAAAELVLRRSAAWHRPLFRGDARYEYMPAPHQAIVHGGLRYATNELGMRSGPVGAKKKRRVLVVGDSVINGAGTSTQDSLATTIVEERLDIQVLNCSAPSWGAANAAAWITAHGLLDADHIVAVFSSHDAFDRMTFEPLVGLHPSYPDHRPAMALEMILQRLRYRLSRHNAPAPRSRRFDPGWSRLRDLARDHGAPLTVLLHPQRDEVIAGRYDDRGQELIDSLASWHIAVVPLLGRMDATLYADAIHVNDAGQRAIAAALVEALK